MATRNFWGAVTLRRAGTMVFLAIWPVLAGTANLVAAESAVHECLHGEKLVDAEATLTRMLAENPQDDEARLGLGIVQFGRGLESFFQDLNRHGFLTERTFGSMLPPQVRELFPDDPDPQPFGNEAYRVMLQHWLHDVNRAERTLAAIEDPNVKLLIYPALISFDPAGNGHTISASQLLRMMFPVNDSRQIEEFGLMFDRGDVHWLRGYLHFEAAMTELLLAHDAAPVIEQGAHLLFEKVETPYTWLLEEDRSVEFEFDDSLPRSIDMFAALSNCLNVKVVEPARFASAHDHLLATVANGQEMWKHILAETDDDREWIPSPGQRSRIGVSVNQEMVDTWLATLAEVERVLKGDVLVPFWRDALTGTDAGSRGINVRKVFQNPPARMAVMMWVQGTAATPYLEEGELTQFTDVDFLLRIDEAFGPQFIGFAAWFN